VHPESVNEHDDAGEGIFPAASATFLSELAFSSKSALITQGSTDTDKA
jgi:hypothetical protein